MTRRTGMDPRSIRIDPEPGSMGLFGSSDIGRPRLSLTTRQPGCAHCGVRAEVHAQFGCREWIDAA